MSDTSTALAPASKNLSIMIAHATWAAADAEERFSWEIDIIGSPGEMFSVVGRLEAVGDGVECHIVALSSISEGTVPHQGEAVSADDVARTLPDSYLIHSLYDFASSAARTASALVGRGPSFPRVTPEAKITKPKKPKD